MSMKHVVMKKFIMILLPVLFFSNLITAVIVSKISFQKAVDLSNQSEELRLDTLPYLSTMELIRLLMPALLFGFIISIMISIFFAIQFSASISNPLHEIADRMRKMKSQTNQTNIFPNYKYHELNVIARNTMRMSSEVEAYVKKVDMERHIRQEFFSNASHELKTPITSIRGYAELLENNMVADEDMKKSILGRIRKEAENMTGLINDILMISKLETKETKKVKVKMDMSTIIEELADNFAPLAQEESVTMTWDCQPLYITADPQQMKELASNLIMNAIKYNKPNGTVHISVKRVQDEMILMVKDTGIGIMKIDMNRIFERFYRANKGRSKKVNGTGLGLSIVKHIVNFYEGNIEVKSDLDKGTTFTVHIPIV